MSDQHQGRVVRLTSRGVRSKSTGNPPTGKIVRSAKLAALPGAYVGRRVAGAGKRVLGRPADQVDQDIRLRTAQHMFEALGELKGCAQKLGQLLAIYEMALPADLAEPYRIALSRLQHSGPAMLAPMVHQAMAANMGENWRSHFRGFDDRRPAAASVGQVHRAVWRDGTPVAVKVMYPGAREAVLNDLDQLRRAATPLSLFLPGTDVRSVVDAVGECVREELDYQQEAAYQQAFAQTYTDDPDFVVPRVLHQQGDVLISEWIHGVPVSRLVRSGSQVERDRIALLIVRFVMTSFTRTGLLYGDPHPGNFLVQPDGRLGVVDFGACSAFPEGGIFDAIADIYEAVFNGGVPELEDAIRRHGFVAEGRHFDVEQLAESIPLIRETWLSRHQLTTSWLRSHVLQLADLQLFNVARQLDTPPEAVPIVRTIFTLLGVLCQLEAEGSIRHEILSQLPQLARVIERFNRRNRHARSTGITDIRRINSLTSPM
jgi:predicted unusual protein kinase regulating ubiquinone biosynthesis (AarF/ABC1/UbiB family)